jgi:hypothetical protein
MNSDYPKIPTSGSFPVDQVVFGPAFQTLLNELSSDAFREAFEDKFGIDLSGRPTITTVRSRCGVGDGKIHTDSVTKIITVLIYMNAGWDQPGGRLRLLRSSDDLNDIIVEVPPIAGTLLAFKRSNNSSHRRGSVLTGRALASGIPHRENFPSRHANTPGKAPVREAGSPLSTAPTRFCRPI